MIDEAYGSFFLTCDICLNSAEEKFEDFNEAVEYKKTNGWKSQKKHDQWEDVCPDCRGE